MLEKLKFYYFFQGLMSSETNDFRNGINKNNINDLVGVVVSYVLV